MKNNILKKLLIYDYNASTVQNGGYVYMRDENDNLLIGSSPVVFCGNTMKNNGLSKYKIDVIGYGGLLDEMCGDLFDNIGDKKYNKIILWNAINDVNAIVRIGYSTLDDVYFNDFIYLINKAKEHLKDSSSKIYFVKLKKISYGSDSTLTQKQVDDFNYIVDFYNELIDTLKYNTYEIPFDTSEDNSDGYIHYTNINVFEDLLGILGT